MTEFFEKDTPVITGSKIAGESTKIRKQLEKTIDFANSSMFDIADLLLTIKKNGYYEGFNTFSEFTKSLKFKNRRLLYLTKMAETMDTLGIPREKYEPIGISKLREITSLDVNGEWKNTETGEIVPLSEFIKGFVEKGTTMSLEEIHTHVQTLKGFSGENSMGWLHLYMKQIVIDKVAKPALEKAKMQIGSVSKDEEGNSLDASDGAAAEVIFVSFINEEA